MISTRKKSVLIMDHLEEICRGSKYYPTEIIINSDIVIFNAIHDAETSVMNIEELSVTLLEKIIGLLEERSKENKKLCKRLHMHLPYTLYMDVEKAARIFESLNKLSDELCITFSEFSDCKSHLSKLISILGYSSLHYLDLTRTFENRVDDQFSNLLKTLLRSGICSDDVKIILDDIATTELQKETLFSTLSELNPTNEGNDNDLVPKRMTLQCNFLYDDGAKSFARLLPTFYPLWSFKFPFSYIQNEGMKAIAVSLLRAGNNYNGTISLDLRKEKISLEVAQTLANCFCYSSATINVNYIASTHQSRLFSQDKPDNYMEKEAYKQCLVKIGLINKRNQLLKKYENDQEKIELIKDCFGSVDMFPRRVVNHAKNWSVIHYSEQLFNFFNSELRPLLCQAERINACGRNQLAFKAEKIQDNIRTLQN